MRTLLRTSLLLSLLACSSCKSAAPASPTTTVQPAEKLDPAGSYRSGGDCPHGSAENPTCTSQLELLAGGTGTFVGDDIVEDLTWSVEGDRVVIDLGSRSFVLASGPDGTLVGDDGVSWQRRAE